MTSVRFSDLTQFAALLFRSHPQFVKNLFISGSRIAAAAASASSSTSIQKYDLKCKPKYSWKKAKIITTTKNYIHTIIKNTMKKRAAHIVAKTHISKYLCFHHYPGFVIFINFSLFVPLYASSQIRNKYRP